MKKLLTILFFFILLFIAGGITETVCSIDSEEIETLSHTLEHHAYSDADSFHNNMAATEINTYSQSQQNVNIPRVKRAYTLLITDFLKSFIRNLSLRDSHLAQHTERLYGSSTNYFCEFGSEYYVFALRRIII